MKKSKIFEVIINSYSDLDKNWLTQKVEDLIGYEWNLVSITDIKLPADKNWVPYNKLNQKKFSEFKDYCVSLGKIDVRVNIKN